MRCTRPPPFIHAGSSDSHLRDPHMVHWPLSQLDGGPRAPERVLTNHASWTGTWPPPTGLRGAFPNATPRGRPARHLAPCFQQRPDASSVLLGWARQPLDGVGGASQNDWALLIVKCCETHFVELLGRARTAWESMSSRPVYGRVISSRLDPVGVVGAPHPPHS